VKAKRGGLSRGDWCRQSLVETGRSLHDWGGGQGDIGKGRKISRKGQDRKMYINREAVANLVNITQPLPGSGKVIFDLV